MEESDVEEFNQAYINAKAFDFIVEKYLFEKFKTFKSNSYISNLTSTVEKVF